MTTPSSNNRTDFGSKFHLAALNRVIEDPSDTSTVEIPCFYSIDPRSGESVNSLWVGAFTKSRTPFSVSVVNPDGSPKRSEDIARIGAMHDKTNNCGHARVLIRPDDLIVVGVRSFSYQMAIILRIDCFTKTESESCTLAICDTVKVLSVDHFGEESEYTHEAVADCLNAIPQNVRDLLLVNAKTSTKPPVGWWQHNLEHFAVLSKRRRNDIDFETREESDIAILSASELFPKLRSMVGSYYRNVFALIKEDKLDRKKVLNHRTPLRVEYSISDEETKGVFLTVSVPYVARVMVAITDSTYRNLLGEPLLTFRSSSFGEFYDRVSKQIERNNGEPVTNDFMFRL